MATRRLVINGDAQGPFFLRIDGDSVTVVGGRPDAPTVLQHLRVTHVHCVLVLEGDNVTVRSDEPSARGTPRALRPGEVVGKDGAQLCLQGAEAPAAPPAPPPAAAPAPAQQTGLVLEKRLRVIDGADVGRSHPLPKSGTVTLGKDRKHSDIVLHDLYVARVHCLIRVDGDTVEVADDGGHVTLVNGKQITKTVMVPGDVLRIGNTHLKLEAVPVGKESAGKEPAAPEEDEAGGYEEVELTVEEEGSEDAEVEPAGDEDEAEPLPANASEAVRLLCAWREKLTGLSGQTFGHYRIGPVLGRGRCGVVFQADDDRTGQPVALKVFSPQFPQGDQELQRFARLLKGILPLRHPNLVGLCGAGKTGGYTWVAREYVEGESVAQVIRRLAEEERGDVRRACRVAVHVGRALDFARKQHLRHGQVTPANVLLQKSDKAARLADLGLGSVLEGSQLAKAALEYRTAADAAYLSPEQADPGAFVDELSDVYGLGAVVYALLTGRPPFVGKTAEEVLEQLRSKVRVTRPTDLNDEVPPALAKVVLKMLARRQEDRYQTPDELLADLEPIAEEEGIAV